MNLEGNKIRGTSVIDFGFLGLTINKHKNDILISAIQMDPLPVLFATYLTNLYFSLTPSI